MRPATARLLTRLAGRRPCAVISGRGLADLAARVPPAAGLRLVGNHGAEAGGAPRHPTARRRVERWRARLEIELRGLDGVVIEDKGLSLSVHYRRAPRPARVERLVHAAAASLGSARAVGGKMVVNVVAASAAHKGAALVRLARALGVSGALYVGDDDTDEDAFGALGLRPFVAVRVGRRRTSRAPYCLDEQGQIDALLATLLALDAPGLPRPREARGARVT